jgi:putative DNA primase/helicase
MIKQYACTDLGNGERFNDYYGFTVRYLIEEDRWIQHTEDGWKYIDDGHQLTPDVVRRIYKETSDKVSQDETTERQDTPEAIEARQRLANWSVYSESTTAQNHMLREAQAKMGIHITDFDADPYLVNCRNGVIDLRTKDLIPHTPNRDALDRRLLHLKRANASYSPESACEKWCLFLRQIFNEDHELMNYIRLGLGYSTTGLIREHLFFLCHGTGRNGKGKLLDTVLHVLGDYGRTSEFEIFLQSKKELTDARRKEAIGNLRGRRLIVASENKDSTQLNSSLVKKLTGGDPLEGARLYGDSFEFVPTHKIWLRGNHMPSVTEGTDAIWERVKAVPFKNRYVGKDDNTKLGDILQAEADAIFTHYLVPAAQEYIKNGMPDLPEAVKIKTEDYRNENDKLSLFIKEQLRRTPKQTVRNKPMVDRYEQWCRDNALPTDTSFFRQRMEERNIYSKRDKNGFIFMDCELTTTELGDVSCQTKQLSSLQ